MINDKDDNDVSILLYRIVLIDRQDKEGVGAICLVSKTQLIISSWTIVNGEFTENESMANNRHIFHCVESDPIQIIWLIDIQAVDVACLVSILG
jgi:hypothetical protein